MSDLENIIKNIVDRIRKLESGQEGNGFVPFLSQSHYGSNAMTTHGIHTVRPLSSPTDYALIEFIMPRQVTSLSEAILEYIPIGTGTWDYTITTTGGYCGEDEAQHTDSMTANAIAVTNDELECLDISDALTPYHAGDIVAFRVVLDALSTVTAINVIGVRLR